MFSQTTEYALRVIVFLGTRIDAPSTIRQIAAATRVPEAYLAKVLLSLSRVGLIHSQRGLHGGSILTRSPREISVFDVIEAVDPIRRIESCPLGLKNHGVRLCPLHKRLDDALELVIKAFKESSIADLLADPNPSKSLCDAEGNIPQAEPVRLRVARRTPAKAARRNGSN